MNDTALSDRALTVTFFALIALVMAIIVFLPIVGPHIPVTPWSPMGESRISDQQYVDQQMRDLQELSDELTGTVTRKDI